MATIVFKCTEAQKIELTERADGNISEYIRKTLFQNITQESMLEVILHRLEKGNDKTETVTSGLDDISKAMLLELLLLMRMSVPADRKKEVQEEVSRVGFEVWGYESQGGKNGR